MTNNEQFKAECKAKCDEIFKASLKDPYEWIWRNALSIEQDGKYLRVQTYYGGPTEWWTFNTESHKGRYFYHYGNVQCLKAFGKGTYKKIMEANMMM